MTPFQQGEDTRLMKTCEARKRTLRPGLAAMMAALSIVSACGGDSGSADEPDPAAPVDSALAARGEDLFTAKGCVACHYVGRGQRLVGPDLLGAPTRRSYSWIRGMVSNPDSMLRSDETAKELLGQYMTPMANQGVTDDEIRAIWEYLRRATADAETGAP